MGQSSFLFSIQTADGEVVEDCEISVEQGGSPVAYTSSDREPGYFEVSINTAQSLHISATHPQYEIDAQILEPPFVVFTTVLTAGRPDDPSIMYEGHRRFVPDRSDLIVLMLLPAAWQDLSGTQALQEWVERNQLVEVPSPWEQKGGKKGHQEPAQEYRFYRKADGSPFSPDENLALEEIRQSGLVKVAGIPLWEGVIMGNEMVALECEATPEWLNAHDLIISGPGGTDKRHHIIVPPSMGWGLIQLLKILNASGLFSPVEPVLHFSKYH